MVMEGYPLGGWMEWDAHDAQPIRLISRLPLPIHRILCE